MAKGNLFQGMARGKVGDVVFSRLNGEQIARVRNRHPKNPRTNAQLYQRAIMATIMQAYSAGKEIFDHSFQGKTVGDGNMRTFLSRNIKSLRGQLASEIKQGVTLSEEVARVVAPSSITPVPVVGLIASEGELTQNLFTIKAAAESAPLTVSINGGGNTSLTVAQWMANNNIKAGDIFTFVAFVNDTTDIRFLLETAENGYGTQYNAHFGWARFIVKNDITVTNLQGSKLADIFNVEVDGEVFTTAIGNTAISGTSLTLTDIFGSANASGTFGIIRSRDDEDVRSTCIMQEINVDVEYGIVAWYALESWQKGDQALGNSDLILEGGSAGVSGEQNTNQGGGGGSSSGSDLPPGGGGD